MKKSKSFIDNVAPSMAAAATRLGVSMDLLCHCKELDWDCFNANGTIGMIGLRKHLAANKNIVTQFENVPLTKIESALIMREKRLALEDKRLILNKTYKHIDEIKREAGRYISFMKTRQIAMETNTVLRMRVEAKIDLEQEAVLRAIIIEESRAVLDALFQGEWFREEVKPI